jgi:hypothetical protein
MMNIGYNTAIPRQRGIQLHIPAVFNACTHGNNGRFPHQQVGIYRGHGHNEIGNQFSNFQAPIRCVCVQHSFIFCLCYLFKGVYNLDNCQ